MDGDGKHIGGQGLWGHCNSKCPTDLSKNTFGFITLNIRSVIKYHHIATDVYSYIEFCIFERRRY